MILNLVAINLLLDRLGHLGIAFALSISSWLNAML